MDKIMNIKFSLLLFETAVNDHIDMMEIIQIEQLNEELVEKDRDLQFEQQKNEHYDQMRRDSIQTVHNNMLTKLLDAQTEHDEKDEILRAKIKKLQSELRGEILRNDVMNKMLETQSGIANIISGLVSEYAFGYTEFVV